MDEIEPTEELVGVLNEFVQVELRPRIAALFEDWGDGWFGMRNVDLNLALLLRAVADDLDPPKAPPSD